MTNDEAVDYEALAAVGEVSWLTTGGGLHLLSGQVALDESSALIGAGDAAAQSEQIFANIDRVLREAGGSIADVRHLRAFITDRSVYPHYAAAKKRWFPGVVPAGTVVVVSGLLDESFLLEVEATAVARD